MFKTCCILLYHNFKPQQTARYIYYLTTPIFYVNAKPHIGHLYTSLLADAFSRYERMKNTTSQVIFMTGTDEHGLKIQQAAQKCGKSESDYVDIVSEKYKTAFKMYNIEYSDFIRTSHANHKQCVNHIWKKLMDRGHIYKGEYSGWYCTADEAFVPTSQLVTAPDGTKRTQDSNRPVEFISEVNYKFRLSAFQDQLFNWLKGDVIRPRLFKDIVLGWVEEGSAVQDVSVSRPASRVPWGIPVPGDESHTVYVWLDALCCYLTGVGGPVSPATWPPDLQIIGKDILKFHAVYWPAFLMGAGLEPPRRLLCHSHWLIDDQKMSKSAGNVLHPEAEADKYTSEGFRYFLLRESVPHSDSNYSAVKVQRILNAELADTLGNLLNRCTGKLVNAAQMFPQYSAAEHSRYCSASAQPLLNALQVLPEKVDNCYSNMELYKGVDAIMHVLHLANGLFEVEKPWELRKRPESVAHLNAVLHITMETLRVCGILLSPIIPVLSDQMLNKLSVPSEERTWNDILPLSCQADSPPPARSLSPQPLILFQRIK